MHPASFDLEHERSNLCGKAEDLNIPLAWAAAGIERDFEHTRTGRIGARDFQRDAPGVERHVDTPDPPAAGVAQVHRPSTQRAPQHVLERPAHQRDIGAPIEQAHDRCQQLADCLPPFALTRRVVGRLRMWE